MDFEDLFDDGEETEPEDTEEPGMVIVPDDDPENPSVDEPAETDEPEGEEPAAETEFGRKIKVKIKKYIRNI